MCLFISRINSWLCIGEVGLMVVEGHGFTVDFNLPETHMEYPVIGDYLTATASIDVMLDIGREPKKFRDAYFSQYQDTCIISFPVNPIIKNMQRRRPNRTKISHRRRKKLYNQHRPKKITMYDVYFEPEQVGDFVHLKMRGTVE